MPTPLLDVHALNCYYYNQKKTINQVLFDVSFTMHQGRHLGVVGQSGSGKSSLIKSIAKLIPSQSQHISFMQQRIDLLSEKQFKPFRKEMQLIFQDPHSSLNPYLSIKNSLLEPLEAFPTIIPKAQRIEYITAMLNEVGLSGKQLKQLPKELSGGMAQRISIARALLLRPKLILADEPVSALDFVIQAQVIELLDRLQEQHNLSYLIISHSLPVIKHLCHDILILHQGRLVEYGSTTQILAAPAHPYTKSLLLASQNPLAIHQHEPKASQQFVWNGTPYSFYFSPEFPIFTRIQIEQNRWLGLFGR